MACAPNPLPPEIEASVKQLREYITGYPECDYSWVIDFAAQAYKETAEGAAYVDGKAERFLAFTSAGTGVAMAILTAAAAGSRFGWLVPVSALGALFCAFAALWQALGVIRPATHYDLPGIDTAFEYAIFFRERGTEAARAEFAAELHRSRLLQEQVVRAKAARFKSAHENLLHALACLSLPIVVAIAVRAFLH